MDTMASAAQVAAARRGGEAELAAIIARFMPVIRRAVRKNPAPWLDFDDAVQEGIIGLFHAIQTWREGQRASFQTYAAVCIQNAVISARRTAGRKKHAPLNHSVPIPEAHSTPGPEEAAIATEEAHHTLEKARTMLTQLEKTVLQLTLDGYSHAQIAGKTGRSPKAVESTLARVRRKLR